jgi:hypothetical protein
LIHNPVMITRALLPVAFTLFATACTVAATGAPAAAPALDAGAGTDASIVEAPTVCEPIAKASRCKGGEEGALVRGIARFDVSKRAPGTAAPTLTLFLRHAFVVAKTEARIGGRLHGFLRVKLTPEQLESGEVPFTIDMCGLGTAMWSEENGMFNLVAILDENNLHDLENSADPNKAQIPQEGELMKMTEVEVSCHKPSPCVGVRLDCVDGQACTTITPITSLMCSPNACTSDSSFCKGAK